MAEKRDCVSVQHIKLSHCPCNRDAVPQIRGNRDNFGRISHISKKKQKNISCDPSLEPSHRDGFIEGLQHMYSLRSLNYPKYPFLSGALGM